MLNIASEASFQNPDFPLTTTEVMDQGQVGDIYCSEMHFKERSHWYLVFVAKGCCLWCNTNVNLTQRFERTDSVDRYTWRKITGMKIVLTCGE